MAPDLKKIPAENYMAPDPANFVHQLDQKESCEKGYERCYGKNKFIVFEKLKFSCLAIPLYV
jgi:hypothetical protein